MHYEDEVPREVNITTVLTASLMLEDWFKRLRWSRKLKRPVVTKNAPMQGTLLADL